MVLRTTKSSASLQATDGPSGNSNMEHPPSQRVLAPERESRNLSGDLQSRCRVRRPVLNVSRSTGPVFITISIGHSPSDGSKSSNIALSQCIKAADIASHDQSPSSQFQLSTSIVSAGPIQFRRIPKSPVSTFNLDHFSRLRYIIIRNSLTKCQIVR